MEQNKFEQTIIITGNAAEARFQIIIPPFRPINMFELEDDFDNVVEEIEMKVANEVMASAIIRFITAFKDSIETEEVVPLLNYFISQNIKGLNPSDMNLVFQALREYIHYSNDQNRLMH